MLDLHVHVLPGIDDGPRTLEDALALARALADDGIEHIVATPHIYPGVFDNSAALIGAAFNAFQSAVSDAGIDLTMTWAAEVRICPEILEWIELRRLPMLNGSLVGPSTALIELPDGQIPVGTDKLMGLMLERGITPLMAHPERNKAVMEQPNRLEALRRLGCKFQLTAGSVLGDFGSRAQTTAQKLLDAGWVDVIATDAHNLSSRRPRMGAARDWIAQHFDEALALRLTKTQPTELAGVSSFTFQAGEQKLVFRDLPPTTTPLDAAESWSMDLMLDATGIAKEPPSAPADSSKDSWSLIDFRIDALVADLQSTSLQHHLPTDREATQPSVVPNHDPALDLTEDWRLPTFSSPLSPPSPPPPMVAPAPMPPLRAQPVRPPPPSHSEAVALELPVLAPAPVVAPVAVPAPTPVPAPAATPVLAAVHGLRLSEVEQRQAPQPSPSERTGSVLTRTGSIAQVGHQSLAIRRPHDAHEPREATVAPTVNEPRRGFRLSDLKPLGNRRR